MTTIDLTAADLDALAAFDTPTVCNALERLDPALQGRGYTTRPPLCGFPAMKPIVGYARTAVLRSAQVHSLSATQLRRLRDEYYRHIDTGPRPSIAVIEDVDGAAAGYGAFWGEVQSAIHVGLGALGVITNGSVRDLDQWAPGFQFLAGCVAASHAYAMPVAIGIEIEVFGLRVRPGDLLHADRHGAVVVPVALARAVPEAARAVAVEEARILAVARGGECTAERLIAAFPAPDGIH